jgi:hypothetical protein
MECKSFDGKEAVFEVNENVTVRLSTGKINLKFTRSDEPDGIIWTSDIDEFFKITSEGGQLDHVVEQMQVSRNASVLVPCGISKHVQIFQHPVYNSQLQVQFSSDNWKIRFHIHYYKQMLVNIRKLVNENSDFALEVLTEHRVQKCTCVCTCSSESDE